MTLTSQASGATASTSRAMSSRTGTLRSARRIPPGPTLSPIGWRMPYCCGISMSCCIESNPPTENAVMTNSAPSSAALRSGSARTCIGIAALARDVAAQILHALHAFGVEIVQHDIGADERRRVREVGQQPRRPVVRPTADDRDLRRHYIRSRRSLMRRSVRAMRVRVDGPRPRPRRDCSPRAWRGCSRRARSRSSCEMNSASRDLAIRPAFRHQGEHFGLASGQAEAFGRRECGRDGEVQREPRSPREERNTVAHPRPSDRGRELVGTARRRLGRARGYRSRRTLRPPASARTPRVDALPSSSQRSATAIHASRVGMTFGAGDFRRELTTEDVEIAGTPAAPTLLGNPDVERLGELAGDLGKARRPRPPCLRRSSTCRHRRTPSCRAPVAGRRRGHASRPARRRPPRRRSPRRAVRSRAPRVRRRVRPRSSANCAANARASSYCPRPAASMLRSSVEPPRLDADRLRRLDLVELCFDLVPATERPERLTAVQSQERAEAAVESVVARQFGAFEGQRAAPPRVGRGSAARRLR